MSPDDRLRAFDHDSDVVVPFGDGPLDGELAALDRELRAAGDRMRRMHARDGRGRPSASFESSLRARLLADHAATTIAATPTLPVETSDADDRPMPVRPSLTLRVPTVLPSPRWSVLAVAAVLVASLLGVQVDRFFAAPAPARVTDAVGASLVRDGARLALVAGTSIVPGDQVEVSAAGGASLQLGGSVVRVAGGGSMRIDALVDGIALTQLDGRAWHRVSTADDEPYTVTTGSLRWSALGTAFDLSIEPGGSTADVRLFAVEHDVALAGPGLALTVAEGREAVVRTGRGTPEVIVDDLPASAADPWLLANARLDAAAGFGVGWLTTAILAPTDGLPTPRATIAPDPATRPSTSPTAPAPPAEEPDGEPPKTTEPDPAPTATPTATPRPRPTATPRPPSTPKPTATPKPTKPPVADLDMDAVACAGTAVLDWEGTSNDAFNHWTVVRAPEPFGVPDTYPPDAPATALESSYTTNPDKRTFADPGLGADGVAWYRAVAWDAEDRAIASTDDVKLIGSAVASLGTLEAAPAPGGFEATWAPFDGPGACFTYYKVSWSATNPNPSYLGDNDGAQALDGASTDTATIAIGPGTWYARVEAIGVLAGKKVLVARSTVAEVIVEP